MIYGLDYKFKADTSLHGWPTTDSRRSVKYGAPRVPDAFDSGKKTGAAFHFEYSIFKVVENKKQFSISFVIEFY